MYTGWGPEREVSWYALRTRSNFEAQVASQLTSKGFENYLPVYEETHQWKDRKKRVLVPLFGGYLFARFDESAETRVEVVRTTGVVGIVGWGGKIQAVEEQELESVRTLLMRSAACMPYPFLQVGDWVRVRKGALKGVEGILVRTRGKARLVISISVLSQSMAAEVNAQDIEPIKRPISAQVKQCIPI
jgi:transcription antitermination factor NusG